MTFFERRRLNKMLENLIDKDRIDADVADILNFWSMSMTNARRRGFTFGQISSTDTKSLIPASWKLAKEMDENVLSSTFAHMPGQLLNDPNVVDAFLPRFDDSIALLAVLVGQSTKDLMKVTGLFEALNTVEADDDFVGAERQVTVCIENTIKQKKKTFKE